MQREQLDSHNAAVPPRDVEPSVETTPQQRPHVRGVQATSAGLIRATLGSAVAAGLILVLFWLPAEYGIDVTGVGRVMGLTEMGEIKQQLFAEAAAEDAALAAQASQVPTMQAVTDPLIAERLSAIEAQLATIVAAIGGAGPATDAAETPTAPVEVSPTLWRDEVSYTLAPTEGIEVKLVMQKGAIAEFEWSANGAVLNHDTHGSSRTERITYEQGRGVPGQEGELVAAFSGDHGWFWRNRTEAPVTFTLRTRGDYAKMKAP